MDKITITSKPKGTDISLPPSYLYTIVVCFSLPLLPSDNLKKTITIGKNYNTCESELELAGDWSDPEEEV